MKLIDIKGNKNVAKYEYCIVTFIQLMPHF